MKIRVDTLIAYAKNAVGGGYCWGADGQTCSKAVRQELANRTSNEATKKNLLNLCAKWDGTKVWDCSGLFRGAWRALSKYRSGGATTIYREWCDEKGTLDTMPDTEGIAVFRADGTGMAHIGLYVGKGYVIDARSSEKGVLLSTMASYGRWTHWGKFADVDYGAQNEEEIEKMVEIKWRGKVKTKTGNGINLWDTPLKTASVIAVPEGAEVGVIDDSHGAFALAIYEGRMGYADTGYLYTENGSEGASSAKEGHAEETEEPETVDTRYAALEERVAALEKILGITECESCMIGGEENG